MNHLPQELEQSLIAQEQDPTHIPLARKALEEALAWQFRSISRGLLTDRLLRSDDLDDLCWWHQFRSQREEFPGSIEESFSTDLFADLQSVMDDFHPDPEKVRESAEKAAKPFYDNLDATRDFRDRFKTDLIWGKNTPVASNALPDLPIRIYGGVVPMWQEGRINRQLASLGSFFRFWFGKSSQMRMDRMLTELGSPPENQARGVTFIFGIARIPSCVGPAILFDFEREYAVSPYAGRGSIGLVDDNRIVIRRQIPYPQPVSAANFALGHEFVHIRQKGPVGPDSGFLSHWSPIWKQDICAFYQTPRDVGSLAFSLELSGVSRIHYFTDWRVLFPYAENPDDYPLEKLLSDLCKEGLLEYRSSERKFYCPLFEEGKRWLMI